MPTMTAPFTEQLYTYGHSSELVSLGGRPFLHMATSGGLDANLAPAAHPYFYSGFPNEPMSVAAGLLVVAKVSRTRYYVPPGMLAAILRAADPVVTSSPQGLRFESFSACCGVYARLDVAADALDTEFQASGVTNVDVNPPLRQALAGLRPGEPLQLAVGDDGLRVRTLDAEAVEEKVELPRRWLKGFCEVQASASTVALRHELGPEDARRFIRSLPRTSSTGSVAWATRGARSLRLASRPSPGAVCLAGPERLRTLEPLMRFATGLRIYGRETDSGSLPSASTWVLDLPGARLSLTLSPDKSRGFPGEGGVLHEVAGAAAQDDAGILGAALAFEPRIDLHRLGGKTGLRIPRVADALAVLASSGQVGFDVAESGYFHRPLPFETGDLLGAHPRLEGAHKLLSLGAVAPLDPSAPGAESFAVHSGGTEYRVHLREQRADSCSCPWFAKYKGGRGPCKHVLAARIFQRDSNQTNHESECETE
ncbi:SWIM zinc finger family protein [Paeniglutamicibacter sp. NPDC091659]|uniref:SWIM zinc finger family protein n=1 Tax=Paeniglutamicibacter sp. NPDC091659 TaxID=3364389 RepID=UPI0037F40297